MNVLMPRNTGKRMISRFGFTLLFIVGFFTNQSLQAQKDPVLFTVDKKDVRVSEFDYIYSKTNGEKASYSKESLNEYLELYKKFKLKVAAAKEMKLDTIPSLMQELDGYRRQLADSYLTDKEVTERLVKEAYERSKTDISLSHILVKIPGKSAPADTLQAYQKALDLMKKIRAGESFALVAKNNSDDKSTSNKGGTLGFFVAPFPNGFYALENAAYNTPKGKIAGPIRTKLGYHIIKVHTKRPARGEIEAAHILIRKDAKDSRKNQLAKAKIDSLYTLLQNGGDFKMLAKANSEDKTTAAKEGYIGFFGVNRFEKAFEDAVFGLKEDGTYTKPIESQVGYHIIKRISKRENETYDIAKRRLQPKIKKDQRFNLAKEVMIERIKKEGQFSIDQAALQSWLSKLTEEFLTFKWKPAATADSKALFSFGNELSFFGKDFEKYCQSNSRLRIRKAGNETPKQVGEELFEKFVDQSCIKYEETQLERKYPDFKSLMREYEEGILLFEATKINVWDKASQDTVGLKAFHEKNKNKFSWKERAKVKVITVKEEGRAMMAKINKYAQKHTAEEIADKFNKPDEVYVAVSEKTIEKGKDEMLDAIEWTAGKNTGIKIDPASKRVSFMQIEEIIPPGPKTLKEARGYIIADYQDQLEKEWIRSLQNKYKIKVNQKVFNSLIK